MTTILIFEHYEDVKSTYHGIFMRDASIWFSDMYQRIRKNFNFKLSVIKSLLEVLFQKKKKKRQNNFTNINSLIH